MKKLFSSLICLILLSVFSSDLCLAADWRAGKETYRTVCSNCHKTRGEAERLSLNSRTRDEWSAFFAQAPVPVHQKVWDKLNKEDVGSLEQYFRKYAKDTKELLG
ncbi:MAG: hypothetical protein RBR43_01820 [Desulfuromonadaceae bacterium]|nr:hypothetical protein [Desulfuromonas sp.]MDY0184603.1 hypothetical protein [Desulfuromonadaceae bacterium]